MLGSLPLPHDCPDQGLGFRAALHTVPVIVVILAAIIQFVITHCSSFHNYHQALFICLVTIQMWRNAALHIVVIIINNAFISISSIIGVITVKQC